VTSAELPDVSAASVYRQVARLVVWLTDAEFLGFARELHTVVQPRLANGPEPGRNRLLFATIVMPADASVP
jgi:hypothetical protein